MSMLLLGRRQRDANRPEARLEAADRVLDLPPQQLALAGAVERAAGAVGDAVVERRNRELA